MDHLEEAKRVLVQAANGGRSEAISPEQAAAIIAAYGIVARPDTCSRCAGAVPFGTLMRVGTSGRAWDVCPACMAFWGKGRAA